MSTWEARKVFQKTIKGFGVPPKRISWPHFVGCMRLVAHVQEHSGVIDIEDNNAVRGAIFALGPGEVGVAAPYRDTMVDLQSQLVLATPEAFTPSASPSPEELLKDWTKIMTMAQKVQDMHAAMLIAAQEVTEQVTETKREELAPDSTDAITLVEARRVRVLLSHQRVFTQKALEERRAHVALLQRTHDLKTEQLAAQCQRLQEQVRAQNEELSRARSRLQHTTQLLHRQHSVAKSSAHVSKSEEETRLVRDNASLREAQRDMAQRVQEAQTELLGVQADLHKYTEDLEQCSRLLAETKHQRQLDLARFKRLFATRTRDLLTGVRQTLSQSLVLASDPNHLPDIPRTLSILVPDGDDANESFSVPEHGPLLRDIAIMVHRSKENMRKHNSLETEIMQLRHENEKLLSRANQAESSLSQSASDYKHRHQLNLILTFLLFLFFTIAVGPKILDALGSSVDLGECEIGPNFRHTEDGPVLATEHLPESLTFRDL